MAAKGNKPMIWIELTPEQKEQVKQATGLELSQLGITGEELEERIAPRCIVKTVDKATPL